MRRRGEGNDYVSICTPNPLHDAQIRFALRMGAHAICEKPLVANTWNIAPLEELSQERGKRIYPILQLREHPVIIELRDAVQKSRREFVTVRWLLSIDGENLPAAAREEGKTTYRSITVDGKELEFSGGFTDLHTQVYRKILANDSFSPGGPADSLRRTDRPEHLRSS